MFMKLIKKARKVKKLRNKIDLLYAILPADSECDKIIKKREKIFDKIYSHRDKIKKLL